MNWKKQFKTQKNESFSHNMWFYSKKPLSKPRQIVGVIPENPQAKIHEVIKRNNNEKQGRRSNQQRIKEIREKLVASCQLPTIEATFSIQLNTLNETHFLQYERV